MFSKTALGLYLFLFTVEIIAVLTIIYYFAEDEK